MVDSFDPGSGCAARSMIVAAGRWECGNLLVLEISSISTAAFGQCPAGLRPKLVLWYISLFMRKTFMLAITLAMFTPRIGKEPECARKSSKFMLERPKLR